MDSETAGLVPGGFVDCRPRSSAARRSPTS